MVAALRPMVIAKTTAPTTTATSNPTQMSIDIAENLARKSLG
jgi:hypothetical protein